MSRRSEYPIESALLQRWSSRAISPESITKEELFSLFEAARWAQSSYNNQPWRFLYVMQGTKAYEKLFGTLVPFNQKWAKNAAALILVFSKKTFDLNGKPSRTHSFDTGAACQNLAVQGVAQGLVVHGMEGFDYDKARELFTIPDEYQIEAVFAVGKPGPVKNLPEDLQKREEKSGRKDFDEFVFADSFVQSKEHA